MKTTIYHLPHDVSLLTAESGSGEPILFVHGFPLNHQMWQEQLEGLADHAHCIAPDLRGFGGSAAGPPVTSLSDYADDLAGLLTAMNIRRPVTLCGLSMGGYIAWQFWQRHAERLQRLILCDTRSAADTAEVARGREMLAQEVLRDGAKVAAERFLPKLFAAHTTAERREPMRQVMLRTRPPAIADALRAMAARPDMTSALPHIQVPTLLLGGEHDAITPPAEMREMATHLPHAQFVQIPHAGHMAPWEQGAVVNAHIVQFCGGLSTREAET